MADDLGIDNVLFDVGDLAAARDLYARLHLTERFAVPEAGIVGYGIGDERPGLLIRVVPGTAQSGPRGPHLWIEVPDARALAASLDEEVPVITTPMQIRTGWVFEIADPWGNVLGFTDYTSDPSRGRGQGSAEHITPPAAPPSPG